MIKTTSKDTIPGDPSNKKREPYKSVANRFEASANTIKEWSKNGTVEGQRNASKAILVNAAEVEKILKERPKVNSKFHPSASKASEPVTGAEKDAVLESSEKGEEVPQSQINEKNDTSTNLSVRSKQGRADGSSKCSKKRKPPTVNLMISLFNKMAARDKFRFVLAANSEMEKDLEDSRIH